MPYLVWLGNKNEEIENVENIFLHSPGYSSVCKEVINPWTRQHRTLDSFGLEDIKLIKIDIEWTEDEFLEGAKETIARLKPILIIEIRGGCGWMDDPEIKKKIQPPIQILEGMGYNVTKIWIDDYLAIPR